MRRLYSFHM